MLKKIFCLLAVMSLVMPLAMATVYDDDWDDDGFMIRNAELQWTFDNWAHSDDELFSAMVQSCGQGQHSADFKIKKLVLKEDSVTGDYIYAQCLGGFVGESGYHTFWTALYDVGSNSWDVKPCTGYCTWFTTYQNEHVAFPTFESLMPTGPIPPPDLIRDWGSFGKYEYWYFY